MLEVRTVFFGKSSKSWHLYFCRDNGTWTHRQVSRQTALRVLHHLRRAVVWSQKEEDELSIKWKFISRKTKDQ